MITHEEARALVNWKKGSKLFDYITQQEQRDKDVARFIELTFSDDINSDDWQEYLALKNKLSKVGKEE